MTLTQRAPARKTLRSKIRIRHIGPCLKVGSADGKIVTDALRITLSDIPE